MGLKRTLLFIAMLLCPTLSLAQTTTVTATITDSDAQTWNNGSVIITFVPTPGVSGQYYIDGVPMTDAQKGPFNVAMNGGGTFTKVLTDNNHISPAGTQWLFTLCSNTSASCSPVSIPVVGTSVNLSTTLSSKVAAPRFPAKGTGYYGYSDTEVNQIPGPGGSYFNVTTSCLRVWNGSSFTCPTAGGAPGGAAPQVQFNNGGNFGGDARLTFNTSTGALSDTGTAFIGTLNNIVTVDGVKYTTANAALADPICSAGTGCTIDMRGNSAVSALALGSFDPGNTPVTLLLGPYTYTTSGITLRTNFHLLGDAGGGPTSSSTGTFITPTGTSTPIIQMPSTAATGIADVNLSNFRIQCAAGNTNQIAMNIVAPANSGLWYSTMNNILIQGCGGEGMLFSSAGYPAINQWIELRSVFINRQINGAPAIHIVGPAGQFITTNCQFDSIAQISGTHDNLPNYVVEDIVTPFVATYNIANYQMTSQGGGVAIKLRGSQNFTCDNCHFEHDYGILNAAQGNNYGNYGVAITNSAIYTSAVNAGAGYLITMDVNAQINFENNSIYAPTAIDNFYLGNLTHLSVKGIFNQANGLPFTAGQSSMRIAEGIFSDSSGFKFVTISTGAISAGARVNLPVNWPTPFADNGYAPFCFVDDFTTTATSQGVTVERGNALPSASGISVTVFNPTGGTVTSNISCLAIRSGS